MTTLRRLILLVVLALVVMPAPAATEPNPSVRQREVIEQILTATKIDQLSASVLDSMFAQIQKQFLDEAAAKGNDPDDIADAKELFVAFRARAAKVNFAQLIHEAQVRLYAKYFTEGELADIAAFYQSPTGKKMVAVMPRLMEDGMKAGVDNLSSKIQALMAEATDEQEHKRPWRRTMADMRELATALEAYQVNQSDETYPQAKDLVSLKAELKGFTTSPKFPETDMWGHAYEYVVSADRHHYRIVSAGADGIFEWDSRRIDPSTGTATPSVRYRDRLEDDIILEDGQFLQLPMQAKPKAKSN